MTTVLSKKGQIVLPSLVREQMHLEPGQDFEVFIENENTITLRRISRRPNQGLVDHLLACPHPLEIPPRANASTPPTSTAKGAEVKAKRKTKSIGTRESVVSRAITPANSVFQQVTQEQLDLTVAKVRRMTKAQRIQSLIDCGILTPKRRLAEHYQS